MSRPKAQVQVDFLRQVLGAGGRIVGANFSLQREPLRSIEPTYFLTLEQNGVRSLQELPWTPGLEHFLLTELHLCLDSPEDEAERFAMILLNNLADAELHHGKDYAQSVFVEVVREQQEYEAALQPLLSRVPTYPPSHDGGAYANCRSFLINSITGLRNEAIIGLHRDPQEATRLMIAALRVVVDETFHITASELLFPRR